MAESSVCIYLKNDGSGNYSVATYYAPSTLPVAAVHPPLDFITNSSQTGTPITITDATNAAPIVLTVASGHGIVADDCVNISGVGGNTNANGNFVITSVTSTTITLQGSSGNAAYTSGGKLVKLAKTTNIFDAAQACVKAIQAYKAAGN